MAKYSKQELKTTLLNTLAVQGIKVHKLDLKKKRGVYVFTIECALFPEKYPNNVVHFPMVIPEIVIEKDNLATDFTNELLSVLRLIDAHYFNYLSDDVVMDICSDNLKKTLADDDRDFGNTYVLDAYIENQQDANQELHKLMFNVANDLFLQKVDQPSLFDSSMPKPSLEEQILANDFKCFVFDQWIKDSDSIVPDYERASLKLNNYDLFMQYEFNQVPKYDEQDLMDLQTKVLRGFKIKG